MSNRIYRYASTGTLSLAVATVLCVGTPARAQSTAPTDNNRSAENRPVQDDGRRDQLAQFDQFLDSHPEISEQLRKNPTLATDPVFVKNHPALQSFLQNNPDVREQLNRDPNVFMRQESQFDRREDNRFDRDISRRNLEDFDRFLDSHREIAEQVRRRPSLVDNREFVQNHPALQDYLQSNPGVRDQLRQDPNAFMRQEDRFNDRVDRTEDARARDTNREHMASFGEFLGGHERIKQDVWKDPTLVKNREYVENHRELNDYLNSHPEVKQEWAANPQEFVRGTQQQFNGENTPGSPTPGNMSPTANKPSGAAAPSAQGSTSPNPAPAQNPNKPKQ